MGSFNVMRMAGFTFTLGLSATLGGLVWRSSEDTRADSCRSSAAFAEVLGGSGNWECSASTTPNFVLGGGIVLSILGLILLVGAWPNKSVE
jgi:hypothetical protein